MKVKACVDGGGFECIMFAHLLSIKLSNLYNEKITKASASRQQCTLAHFWFAHFAFANGSSNFHQNENITKTLLEAIFLPKIFVRMQKSFTNDLSWSSRDLNIFSAATEPNKTGQIYYFVMCYALMHLVSATQPFKPEMSEKKNLWNKFGYCKFLLHFLL